MVAPYASVWISKETIGSGLRAWRCSATAAGDGALPAYPEDVAPEGRVTYLDEGKFFV